MGVAEIKAAYKAYKALKSARKAIKENGGLPWWVYLIPLVAIMMQMLLLFAVIIIPLMLFAAVVNKATEIPGFKQAGKIISGIGCFVGSDSACEAKKIFELADEYGVTDVIKEEFDCSSLPPDWPPTWCDAAAEDLAEDGSIPNPIPKSKQWLIPIYKDAAKEYGVRWEMLAAIHGTRSGFGKKNCKGEGGHYMFTDYEWDTYKVDVGNELFQDRDVDCPVHEEKQERVDGKLKTTHFEYNSLNDKKEPKVDENPGTGDDDEVYDSPDAVFTEARYLKKLGLTDKVEWKYNGNPAGSCTQEGRYPKLYQHAQGGGTLSGTPTPYDPFFIEAAIKYNIPASLLKGMAKVESGFDPNVSSSAGAQGMVQFMPATWKDWVVIAGFPESTPRTNARINIITAGAYISYLMKQRKDARTGFALYNGGIGSDQNLGWSAKGANPLIIELPEHISFEETRNYAFTKVPNAAKEFGWDGTSYEGAGVPPKPGEERKYEGPKPDDKVSKLVATYYNEEDEKKSDNACYVASVHDWYEAIAAYGDSTFSLDGIDLTEAGLIQAVLKAGEAGKIKFGNYGNGTTQVSDVKNGKVDGRILVGLLMLLPDYSPIGINAMRTDHSPGSNHSLGCAVDIGMVKGVQVNTNAVSGKDNNFYKSGKLLYSMPGTLKPTELITGAWGFGPGSWAQPSDHWHHHHFGYDGCSGAGISATPKLPGSLDFAATGDAEAAQFGLGAGERASNRWLPKYQGNGTGFNVIVPAASLNTGVIGTAGPIIKYTVEIEQGISDGVFSAFVTSILSDNKSWTASNNVRLQRVSNRNQANLRVILLSPKEIDVQCAARGVAETKGAFSCGISGTNKVALINYYRWKTGSIAYDVLGAYNTYLINHEVGHTLGLGHKACPGAGMPSPVMAQQSKGLGNCKQNPWPLRSEQSGINP